MTQRMQILKEVWDKWAMKDWWHYANYENDQSNKIIIETKFNPILEIPKLKMFMANYPHIKFELKNPSQQ